MPRLQKMYWREKKYMQNTQWRAAHTSIHPSSRDAENADFVDYVDYDTCERFERNDRPHETSDSSACSGYADSGYVDVMSKNQTKEVSQGGFPQGRLRGLPTPARNKGVRDEREQPVLWAPSLSGSRDANSQAQPTPVKSYRESLRAKGEEVIRCSNNTPMHAVRTAECPGVLPPPPVDGPAFSRRQSAGKRRSPSPPPSPLATMSTQDGLPTFNMGPPSAPPRGANHFLSDTRTSNSATSALPDYGYPHVNMPPPSPTAPLDGAHILGGAAAASLAPGPPMPPSIPSLLPTVMHDLMTAMHERHHGSPIAPITPMQHTNLAGPIALSTSPQKGPVLFASAPLDPTADVFTPGRGLVMAPPVPEFCESAMPFRAISYEDMMSMIMPAGQPMNKEELAASLQAAALGSYED